MTNDQRTTEPRLAQQETVQLTELLPVERSRIKENLDYADQETTDGLRALRSFSQQENLFVEEREFDCFRKIESTTTNFSEKRGKKISTDAGRNGERARISARTAISDNNGETFSNELYDATTRRASANGLRWIDRAMENDSIGPENQDGDDDDDDDDEVYYYRQGQPDMRKILTGDDRDDDADAAAVAAPTNLEILSAGVYRDMANNFRVGTSRCQNATGRTTKRLVERTRSNGRKKRGKKEPAASNEDKVKSEKRRTGHLALTNCSENSDKIVGPTTDVIPPISESGDNPLNGENEFGRTRDPLLPPPLRPPSPPPPPPPPTRLGSAGATTKKYRCVMCDSSFKGSGGLRNHYKVVHAAGPIYKCDECGKEFPLKERLKLHVRTHTGFKPYECPECHKSFARGGQLVQHRGTHSKVKPYRCNLCTGTFTCAANLALHLKRHNGQKDHKCEICGRGFVRKDALKKHLECLHRDVKSFLCVICNKTFKGHLPQHMRTHAQDRPHGCATCGQRFAQKSQLTVHQRTHSGQRPFRCLVCWQAFAHSTALKLHTRRHTGERPFKCAECNAGFTQLPHWKKHMKCIHGRSEPYSCKYCNSFFRIKNDLENHEKTCRHRDKTHAAAAAAAAAAAVVTIATLATTTTTTTTAATTTSPTRDAPEHSRSIGGFDPSSPVASESTAAATAPAEDDAAANLPKFRSMNVERMRLLLAVLLKRISRPERLDELGFGKRLIDEVLQDSLVSAGKEPSRIGELDELETLRRNLETFLEWTVPKEHWDKFRKINKTPEEILETLTAA